MKKLGFTLAEILITLVIIGVIAAMTIPSLMNSTNNEEYRAGLKKAVSSLNQAAKLEYSLNGYMLGLNITTSNNAQSLVSSIFGPRMSILTSGTGTANCAILANNSYVAGATPDYCFTGNDGMIYSVFNPAVDSADGSAVVSKIYVDVNGSKGPNILTTNSTDPKDIYYLRIKSARVMPGDTAASGVMFNEK